MFLFELSAVVFTVVALGICKVTASMSSNVSSSSTNFPGNSSTSSLPPFRNSSTSSDLGPPTVGTFNYQTSYVNGSSAIQSCYTAWAEWSFADWSQRVEYYGVIESWTDVYEATEYSTFTLCDGFPRVDAAPFTTTISAVWGEYTWGEYTPGGSTWYDYPITTTYEMVIPAPAAVVSTYYTTTVVPNTYATDTLPTTGITAFSVPPPDCAIAPSDCYSLELSVFNAQFTAPQSTPLGVVCWDGEDVVYSGAVAELGFPCTISVPIVQLLYWPVTLASQDLCHYPFPIDITATPNNSFTPAAVVDGTTITSNENCYLSYAPLTVSGILGNSNVITSYTLPAGTLSVPSSELQSYRAVIPGLQSGDTFSFNFADLLPNHVPILAYEGQTSCALLPTTMLSYCATIFESMYAPQLVYPTQFKDLDPLLSTCVFDYSGLYDPPTSLVPVGWLIAPTTSAGGGDSTNAPASPSPTIHPGLAAPTTVSFSYMSTAMDGSGDAAANTGNDAKSGPTMIIAPGGGDSAAAVASTIALDPSSTASPPQVTSAAPSAVFRFGGEVLTASQDPAGRGLLINGTPLPDGVVATVNGVEMSAAPGGTAVVLVSEGATQTIPLTVDGADRLVAAVTLPGGNVLTANGPGPQVAVVTLPGGTVLTATSAGGAVLVLGVSLSVGGSALSTGGVVLSGAPGGLAVYADPTGAYGQRGTGSAEFSEISTTMTSSIVSGDVLQETGGLTIITPSIAGTPAPEASSGTHRKNGGQRIPIELSSAVLGVLVYFLMVL